MGRECLFMFILKEEKTYQKQNSQKMLKLRMHSQEHNATLYFSLRVWDLNNTTVANSQHMGQ